MSGPRAWRPITWFALVVNAIFPLWLLHGLQLGETGYCSAVGCTAPSNPLIGMLVIWFIADLLLAAAWALTLPREPGIGPSPFS